MNPPIFIGHASRDKEIVGKLVEMIEFGLYLPAESVFCSSLPGKGIPNGLRFIDYIRQTIDETKLAIFLVSAHFLRSTFCFAEFGAGWVKSANQFILLAPPLKPEELDGIFQGIQAGLLTDKWQLNELAKRVRFAVGQSSIGDTNQWEKLRDEFLKYVISLPPSVLSTQDSNQDINQLTLELQETRGKLEALKKENERLEQLSAAKTASLGQFAEDFEIRVLEYGTGHLVSGATIVMLRGDKVVYSALTQSDGVVVPPAISGGPLSVFVAHRRSLGVFVRKIPTGPSCTVHLSFREGIGSLVFLSGKGRVPGLVPEIEAGMREGRLYMRSAVTVRIDGGSTDINQFYFELGAIHRLSPVNQAGDVSVKIISVIGAAVLLEFSSSRQPW